MKQITHEFKVGEIFENRAGGFYRVKNIVDDECIHFIRSDGWSLYAHGTQAYKDERNNIKIDWDFSLNTCWVKANDPVLYFVARFQKEWNAHYNEYSYDGFCEYCIDTMDKSHMLDYPQQIDEVLSFLNLTR